MNDDPEINLAEIDQVYSYFPPRVYPFDSVNDLLTSDNILYRSPTTLEPASLSLDPHTPVTKRYPARFLVYENRPINYDGMQKLFYYYLIGTAFNPIDMPYDSIIDSDVPPPIPSLQFNSLFESGNLQRAVMIAPNEYDLILRNDSHSTTGGQWFCFDVTLPRTSAAPPYRYKFNIINCQKPSSLFTKGMKPLIYCFHCADLGNHMWQRNGTNFNYFRNNFIKPCRGAPSDYYYTLSFILEFPHKNCKYRVAYSYPYTYSDLVYNLQIIYDLPYSNDICRINALCKTSGKRICPILTITNYKNNKEYISNLPCIILTGRVHPGETPGSWVMQGILDYLTSNRAVPVSLRNKYVFKIVPMLNPDGVAYGNTRTSWEGVDLNRQWSSPNPFRHTSIYYTKEMIKYIKRQGNDKIFLFCDIHGHSRNKNIFLYGCDWNNSQLPLPSKVPADNMNNILTFCNHLRNSCAKNYFSVQSCNFQVQKSRERTGRIAIATEFCISLCFTMEASCCGSDFGILNNCHYNIEHYKQMGHGFIDAIHNYSEIPTSPIIVPRSVSMTPPPLESSSSFKSCQNNRNKSACSVDDSINYHPPCLVTLNLNDPIQRKEVFPNLFQSHKPITRGYCYGNKSSGLPPVYKNYLPIKLIHPPVIARQIPKRRQKNNTYQQESLFDLY